MARINPIARLASLLATASALIVGCMYHAEVFDSTSCSDARGCDDHNACTDDDCTGGICTYVDTPATGRCGLGALLKCNGQGQCAGCVADDQCGTTDDCQRWTCRADTTCEVAWTPEDDKLVDLTSGDCMSRRCDGAGKLETIVDTNDRPVDQNDCTDDVCSADGVPSLAIAVDTPCSGGVCDGQGSCVACNTADQCPGSGDFCRERTCVDHQCGSSNKAMGTVLPSDQQIPGDCWVIHCDGNGAAASTIDVDDRDDGNDCTIDSCDDQGDAQHLDAADGDPCGPDSSHQCDGQGACKLKDGQECWDDTQCANPYCVDGRCCEDACEYECHSCNIEDHRGECVHLPIYADDDGPLDACAGAMTCDGSGHCKFDNDQSCPGDNDGLCASGNCTNNLCAP